MDLLFSVLSSFVRTIFGSWPLSITVAFMVVGVSLILTGLAGRAVLWLETMLAWVGGSSVSQR